MSTKKIECTCGNKISLYDHWENGCSKCGALYNAFGQQLSFNDECHYCEGYGCKVCTDENYEYDYEEENDC